MELTIRQLTPDRFVDLEDLFGPERGASSGCWCMWPRIPGSVFRAMERAERKAQFRGIVERGPPPGLIAYAGTTAVGWVAVGPRASLARFDSGKLSRLDSPQASIFAIGCFYVRAGHRRKGLTARLLDAAVAHARAQGAAAVDACAIETDRKLAWGEGFVGFASVYRRAGFVEIARRSPQRPLMRIRLEALPPDRH
jgi:GNAT superfamily N-acetyltransferase